METLVQTMLESPHAKLQIPRGAESFMTGVVDHTLGKLAKLGPDEAELAERGRLIVESCKDAASTVITVVGYRHYRRINVSGA